MVQRAASHAGATAAALASRDSRAGRARRPRAALPDGAHRPRGIDRPVDRHPRRGPRHPSPLASDAARARRAARGRARHAGAHLLQGRVDLARGIAQAEHRRRPGLLQQGRRCAAPHDRDRCRAMGERAGVRVRAVRDRQQGVHGPRVLRPEAVPQDPHGDVGQRSRSVTGRPTRPSRFARPRDQRRGARRGGSRRHALFARVGPQPRAAAPDSDRAGSKRAARARGGHPPRRRDRLLRRRVEPERHCAPVRARRRSATPRA